MDISSATAGVAAADLFNVLAILSDETVRRSAVDQDGLKPCWKSEKRPVVLEGKTGKQIPKRSEFLGKSLNNQFNKEKYSHLGIKTGQSKEKGKSRTSLNNTLEEKIWKVYQTTFQTVPHVSCNQEKQKSLLQNLEFVSLSI